MEKRIVSLILALGLLVGLLAGCGGGSTGADSAAASSAAVETTEQAEQAEQPVEASAEDSAAEAAEAPNAGLSYGDEGYDIFANETVVELPLTEETVTYSLFTSESPQSGNGLPPLSENLVYQELEKRTGVHLDIQSVTAMAYNEQFMLMIAGGDWTDLLSNVRTTYSGGLGAALSDDVIIDLSNYEEYMPNYMAIINSDENLKRDVTQGGGELGAFYGLYNEKHQIDSGLLVRGDWLDALNLEAPTTVDEYYEVLKAFNSEYGAVMHLPTNGEMANQAFLSAYDIAGFYIDAGFYTSLQAFTVEDGKMICGFTDPGFKSYLELMHKFYSEGLISRDYMSATSTSNYLGDNSDAVADLLNDKIGIWGDSANTIINYGGDSALDPNFRAQPTVLPTLEKGDTIKTGAYSGFVDEAYFSITTACAEPELLVQWCDYAYTAEGYELYNWGVEDVTYTVDADGTHHYTDLVMNNPDYTTEDAKRVYLGVGSYIHDMDAYNSLFNEEQLNCFEVWNSNFTGEHHLSNFAAQTVEEGTRISELSGDLITYLSESVAKFITGEMSLDTDYDKFLDNLEALNISELEQIEQDIYDRWAGSTN